MNLIRSIQSQSLAVLEMLWRAVFSPKKLCILFLPFLISACSAQQAPSLPPAQTATSQPSLTFTATIFLKPTATRTLTPTALRKPTRTRTGTPSYWIPFLTATPLPPTATFTPNPPPTASPTYPANLTRSVLALDNGLTWTECAVPVRDYAMDQFDVDFLQKCVKWPEGSSDADKKMMPEVIEVPGGYRDFRLTIGKDVYETQMDRTGGCCHYFLLKNGEVIREETISFLAYQPNVGLWNMGGKWVWELSSWFTKTIVDGVDLNEKYGLQGSYHPYQIKGKILFVAQKNDKYYLMVDGHAVGPEFDEISMPYCCGMIYLKTGNGQYWFVGQRGDSKYVVSIQ